MADRLEDFDLDDPILPKSIKRKALVSGGYPYADKLDGDSFEPQMQRLQEQLAKLQADQAKTGRRVVIVFEGRDAAGKGGSIKTPAQPSCTACLDSSMESVIAQQPVPGIMRSVGRPCSTSVSSSRFFSPTDSELASEFVPNTARPTSCAIKDLQCATNREALGE